MNLVVPRLACAACGWTPGPLEVDPYPFRCPNAGTDDGDHVVTVGQGFSLAAASADSPNPFIRYRAFLYSWHIARSHGLSDADYVSIVERVDAAVARIAGCGFRITPFCRADRLCERLGFEAAGGVWVKDETGNVAGSHKARHLMGVALYLEVLRHLGIDSDAARPLAVASCGNAALAAAVVARAIDRTLLVFVPDHASPAIVAQLEQLDANVTRCARSATRDTGHTTPDAGPRTSDFGPRTPDSGHPRAAGDPSYLAFRRAVAGGALPFSCQGNENGLVIEGATALGYEIVDQAGEARLKPCPAAAPHDTTSGPGVASVRQGFASTALSAGSLAGLDRIFIQVGGGALASACIQAFAACVRAGRLDAMPRVHAVQTCGGYPLKRAYDRLVDHIFARLAASSPGIRRTFATHDDRARYLLSAASPALLDEASAYARAHRSEFMWPWETEPRSVATGILDDETYDWAIVVEGMVRSGGFPVVVDEATLEEANALAREATGANVDHTGSSGLAGLLALSRSLERPRATERIAVLFTGVRR
jgi:threonine synthase